MQIKEMIKFASDVNYCEGCEHKMGDEACQHCKKREFWKTNLEILNFQRKIQKITAQKYKD